MPCRRRVGQHDSHFSSVPVPHIPLRLQRPGLRETCFDPGQVMLVRIDHQHWPAVGRLHHTLQSVQFGLVNHPTLPMLVIDSPVCHLQQFACQCGPCGGHHVPVCIRQKQVSLHLPVLLIGL